MRIIPIIILAVLGIYLTSCETENEELLDPGYFFMPLEEGRFITYEVDSVYHDVPSGIQDTFHFYVKELIDSIYYDLENRPTSRILRYYADDLSDPWELRNVWIANRTATAGERVEENVRFVRLVFPTDETVTWDGNAQNIYEEWEYSYMDIDAAKTVGDTSYSQTVTVIQRDRVNLLEEEYGEEVYAHGVGMVYKQLDTLKFNFADGISEIETGVELKMTAVSVGLED